MNLPVSGGGQRASERICAAKFESGTKPSIINDRTEIRKFVTRISENYCLRMDKRIGRWMCTGCNFGKPSRTPVPGESTILDTILSYCFLLFRRSVVNVLLNLHCGVIVYETTVSRVKLHRENSMTVDCEMKANRSRNSTKNLKIIS